MEAELVKLRPLVREVEQLRAELNALKSKQLPPHISPSTENPQCQPMAMDDPSSSSTPEEIPFTVVTHKKRRRKGKGKKKAQATEELLPSIPTPKKQVEDLQVFLSGTKEFRKKRKVPKPKREQKVSQFLMNGLIFVTILYITLTKNIEESRE
eukprot:Sdes_comp20980_c1_seq7m19296